VVSSASPKQSEEQFDVSTFVGSCCAAAWAEINPVTHAMDACRALLNDTHAGDSILTTLTWCAVLFVVFCPLAVNAYRRQQ
jgi:ABC-type polysaccharide/polyol phosphate export permease